MTFAMKDIFLIKCFFKVHFLSKEQKRAKGICLFWGWKKYFRHAWQMIFLTKLNKRVRNLLFSSKWCFLPFLSPSFIISYNHPLGSWAFFHVIIFSLSQCYNTVRMFFLIFLSLFVLLSIFFSLAFFSQYPSHLHVPFAC